MPPLVSSLDVVACTRHVFMELESWKRVKKRKHTKSEKAE
jgi:hypothetical protein